MKKILLVGFISLLVAAIFGCDSDSKNARVEVWLTDAPGDYQAVNVDVQGVEVHSDDGDQTAGWKKLEVKQGIYNLLELTNGMDTLLGTIELPAGRISQVRLKLGGNNSIHIGGEQFALKTPSGQQSGLKVQIHQSLSEGIRYKVLLDFDVARSIVTTGNSMYSLKPVIRAITEAQDGAIQGIVVPAEATPAVYAVLNSDTVGTTYPDANGKFLIRGLSAGSYRVLFIPNSDFQATTKEDVSVTIGSVTDIGSVSIAH
jgi:hypothetical protein